MIEFGTEVRHEKDRNGKKVCMYGSMPGKKCCECGLYQEDKERKRSSCKINPGYNWRGFQPACMYFDEKGEK